MKRFRVAARGEGADFIRAARPIYCDGQGQGALEGAHRASVRLADKAVSDLWRRSLKHIDGIDVSTALVVTSEVATDMNKLAGVS